MVNRLITLALVTLSFLSYFFALPGKALSQNDLESCMIKTMKTASAETTIGELKTFCEKKLGLRLLPQVQLRKRVW